MTGLSGARAYSQRIVDNFGWQFACVLISVYGVLRGVTAQIAGSAALPYFKSLGATGDKYQSYVTFAFIPWSMKAAMGILSDAVPFLGYHKRSYIILMSSFGTLSYAILGLVQLSNATAPLAALFLFFAQFQMAFVDLLTEGKYAELMVQKPESGSDLVSFAWGLLNVGSFLGSMVGGPMADNFNPRYIFLICLPLASQVLIPVALGWFPDTKLPPDQRGIRMDKVRRHPDLFKLAMLMTACALTVGIAAMFGSGRVQSIISIFTAAVLCVFGLRWLPATIRRANLYLFLASLMYISIGGASDYWFTAKEECVPGGPKFSFTFYNTYASLVASLAGALGVVIFQKFLSQGTFRMAFSVATMLIVVASFSDIVIFKRLNLRYGVPDEVAFMLGDAVIQPVTAMLNVMPAIVLTSKVCPRGMEASVFALLASYQNIGSAAARDIGVGLTDLLGIKTTVPCNFDGLPLAILIAHVIFPLLSFPLIFILIPDAKMTDDLLDHDDAGSGGEEAERASVAITEDSDLIPPESPSFRTSDFDETGGLIPPEREIEGSAPGTRDISSHQEGQDLSPRSRARRGTGLERASQDEQRKA